MGTTTAIIFGMVSTEQFFYSSKADVPLSTQLVFQFTCSRSDPDSLNIGNIAGVVIAGPVTDILGRRGGMVRILSSWYDST